MENCNVTTDPYSWGPRTKLIKRVTKTIDKYDTEGRLIGREVITEEYEDIKIEEWSPIYVDPYPQPPWIVSSTDGISAMAIN